MQCLCDLIAKPGEHDVSSISSRLGRQMWLKTAQHVQINIIMLHVLEQTEVSYCVSGLQYNSFPQGPHSKIPAACGATDVAGGISQQLKR